MKEITLREMQIIELDMLLAFDALCQKNGLRYYMDGGTLLGAMCYEGFIPWDDDIDLKMPRPDYERFLTMQDQLPAHIRIDVPRRDHCEYTMTKLVDDRTILLEENKRTGVYIDVLPMDGHPEGDAALEAHLKKLRRLNSLFHYAQDGFASMKGIKKHLYRMLYTPWGLYRKMTALAKSVSYDAASHVGLLIEGDAMRERFPKEWLEPAVQLEFEGHFFPAPAGYKPHMVHFYGDHVIKPECYHNLPQYPAVHNHKVFWKD